MNAGSLKAAFAVFRLPLLRKTRGQQCRVCLVEKGLRFHHRTQEETFAKSSSLVLHSNLRFCKGLRRTDTRHTGFARVLPFQAALKHGTHGNGRLIFPPPHAITILTNRICP